MPWPGIQDLRVLNKISLVDISSILTDGECVFSVGHIGVLPAVSTQLNVDDGEAW